MQRPIILQDLSGLGEGISGAGSILGQAMQQRFATQKAQAQQQKHQTILGETLGTISADSSPLEIMKAGQAAIARGVPAETVNQSMAMFKPYISEQVKADAKRQSQRGILADLGLYSGSSGETIGDTTETLKISADQAGGNLSRFSEETLVKMQAIPDYREFAKAELKRRAELGKQEAKLWDFKPTQKFLETVETEAKDAEFLDSVSKEVEDVVLSGKVDPKDPRTFLSSRFGENLPFLFTKESAKLKFLEKLQAKGLKSYFPRPTEREFFFMQSAQAQLGKTPEANLEIARLQRKFDAIPIKAAEFAQEVIKENGGSPPRDLPRRVSEKMKSFKDELFNSAAEITYKYGEGKEKNAAAVKLGIKDKTSKLAEELPMNVPRGTTAKDSVTGEIFIFDGTKWGKK